jgi:hypothetical protein
MPSCSPYRDLSRASRMICKRITRPKPT